MPWVRITSVRILGIRFFFFLQILVQHLVYLFPLFFLFFIFYIPPLFFHPARSQQVWMMKVKTRSSIFKLGLGQLFDCFLSPSIWNHLPKCPRTPPPPPSKFLTKLLQIVSSFGYVFCCLASCHIRETGMLFSLRTKLAIVWKMWAWMLFIYLFILRLCPDVDSQPVQGVPHFSLG